MCVSVCVYAGGGSVCEYVCVCECVCAKERGGDRAEWGKVGSFRFHEIHFNHPLQSTTLSNYKALMLKYKKTHQERDIKPASGNMKIHETHN